MRYTLDLRNLKDKSIYPLGEDFRGTSKSGEEIALTNYYMTKNGKPFFGVSGEFHFCRMSSERWEDELIKMKMGGVSVVATYLFWIHHEEEEGIFRFDGRRNIRRFVELCKKHGLYVILRVGPFNHGEARNGGIPDWMYGKPFELRSLNEGFLFYTKRLYTQIAEQVKGLFFKDDGPIIGVQIDNEYMHSAAPWEITTGISGEWLSAGTDGDAYMLRLKDLAAECGLTPAFYTCTGWGGASTPESMLPLWGGYAFRPWLFYSYKGEHPATEEYVYQDYHNDNAACTDDFRPAYKPETKPYFCCEMGGGMMCSYYYRFQFPYKSVDAMSNIKIASGCNFLGYYMFHGGSNPLGRNGLFMNEGQVPKISYDYQAALGEFGQVRESYRRLKSIHYFVQRFGDRLCGLQTVLPDGASNIAPKDGKTLRYALRTDGKRGFVFINNYQDHFALPDRRNEEIRLILDGEELNWNVSIDSDENTILPFHFDMDGIDLVQANAQIVTKAADTYVFLVADGMQGKFVFEDTARINGSKENAYVCGKNLQAEHFCVEKDGSRRNVLVLSRKMANNMFLLSDDRLVFSEAAVLEDENGVRLETTEAVNRIHVYPADSLCAMKNFRKADTGIADFMTTFLVETESHQPEVKVAQVGPTRYTIHIPAAAIDGVKDALLQLEYTGNIGNAFINGRMISDNFANGAVWEIGLKDFSAQLKDDCITIYIVPLKEDATVNVDSPMAARSQESTTSIAELKSVTLRSVYEIKLGPYAKEAS